MKYETEFYFEWIRILERGLEKSARKEKKSSDVGKIRKVSSKKQEE